MVVSNTQNTAVMQMKKAVTHPATTLVVNATEKTTQIHSALVVFYFENAVNPRIILFKLTVDLRSSTRLP